MTTPKISLRQSDVAMFDECRRKFYLTNVMQIGDPIRTFTGPPTARKVKTQDVGSMVHAAIRLHNRGEMEDTEIILKANSICVETAVLLGGAIEREDGFMQWGEGWPKAIEMSTILIRGYFNWLSIEGHDLRLTTLAAEDRIVWDNGRIEITGQPDRVVLDEITEEVGIDDVKTVDKLGPPRPGNYQLLTYGLLWWKVKGVCPQWAMHTQIVRNMQSARAKPPFYERQKITLGEEILTRHYESIMQTSQEIVDFYERVNLLNHHELARPNMNGECSWKCPVEFLCDHMHDGSDWQHMAETTYNIRTNSKDNAV